MDEENIKKDVQTTRALSIFEGVCFFVAGVCALMAGSPLGYISGGLMVIMACLNMVPAFLAGDAYYINIGTSLVKDETMDDYGERMEDAKNENEDA